MKTCGEYEALISDFLDGGLSEEDRAEVAEHLASCPACQQYFDDLVAMHDAFDQIEEAAVPEGFTEQIMARVRETPQSEAKKVIVLPRWRRWAALAACCAIVALGLWSAQRWTNLPQTAGQTVLAGSASDMTRAAPPLLEAVITADGEVAALTMGEDGAVIPKEAPLPEEDSIEEQKLCRDADASGSLPEAVEDAMEEEADADYSGDAAPVPEPAIAAPAPAGGGQEEALSGIIAASGETVRSWVETELNLEWETGRTYLLTEEEYAGLLNVLTAAGEDFRLEPGEGCWLLAE